MRGNLHRLGFAYEAAPDLGGVRNWLIAGAVAVGLFIVLSVAKGIYADLLWFSSLGFVSLFTKILTYRVVLFVAGAGLFTGFFLGNTYLARRFSPQVGPSDDFLPREEVEALSRMVRWGVLGAAVFLGLIFGSTASGQWPNVMMFFNSQPFGFTDPLYGNDISFYVFRMPLYRFLQMWSIGALIVTAIGAALLYGFNFSLQRFSFTFNSAMKAHLSILGALILVFFAVGYWLDRYDLLYSRRGAVFGASYTDVHAQRLALQVLMIVAGVAAIALVVNVFMRGFWLPTIAVGVWVAAAVLLGTAYPTFVQRFQVRPNELLRERPYIEHNIRYTRAAFGLDNIEEREFPAKESLPPEAVFERNQATIGNIRLWDHRPLKATYNQVQSIRPQYEFYDVDVDRYQLDGMARQVMLSARELSIERLPAQAQTWINQRLVYTHGYGVVVSPVNEVVGDGEPSLIVKDLPPKGILEISRPEIYYGERSGDYVIVNTEEPEFDYPLGEENVYTTYEGVSGVQLSSFLRKLVYAWQFSDANIVLSGHLTSKSRILYYRNIGERVTRVAPFLEIDSDPYLVVADGRLFWIVDGYTTSDRYPYSEPYMDRFNYIRNSVKAVVDAYDGKVTLYVADPKDPVVRTWSRAFPGLLTPLEEMPSFLRSHIRYPEDLFTIQAEMYRKYHMQNPQVFYNQEDLYNVPLEVYSDIKQPLEPYYVIMQLPEEQEPEFLLMMPFTPLNKNNTNAWLAARSDGEHYGKLLAFKFPKGKLVLGPLQVESLIDQDPGISSQFSLWNRTGSRVIRGNLLMVPIEDSYLYVEPIYLQAEQSPFPLLRQVIVASGDRLAMRDTLEESLAAVFGKVGEVAAEPSRGETPSASDGATEAPAAAEPTAIPETVAELVVSAQNHYQKARQALIAGDWATYGRELDAMAGDLAALVELTQQGSGEQR